ncbi:MAG: histidine phosphatase family protein [Sphingomicrobium sp.]
MKRLAILRHASARSAEPGQSDFDRQLADDGWREARRLGREIARRGRGFDLALASPAVRVRETLDGIAEGMGELPFPVRFESAIYDGSPQAMLKLIGSLPASAGSALIAGHNPGLHQVAFDLAGDDPAGLRIAIAADFPAATLALLEFDVDGWGEVKSGSGALVGLILPRTLD